MQGRRNINVYNRYGITNVYNKQLLDSAFA